MDTPTFDVDGYPTDETLEAITKWPFERRDEAFPFIASAWRYPENARVTKPGLWVFATIGWSGNESLINALRASDIWFTFAWTSIYVPGGLLIVATSPAAQKELEQLHRFITQWAWQTAASLGRLLDGEQILKEWQEAQSIWVKSTRSLQEENAQLKAEIEVLRGSTHHDRR